MHIHILGICGTFMGSLAVLAKALGHKVTGSDENVYPPMSTQLQEQGIELMQGYHPQHLQPAPDLVVIGNAMSRGNPAVEYVLNEGLAYTSGPQWLSDHVLQGKHVLAMSGTHGKTTTSSMVAWILDSCGIDCGYLIGGVPKNFDVSARLGSTKYFVIEADEYDSAFFDKRSKFVHYRPHTLVVNNLEFDHADIFDDLAAIQKQFHHVIRTVPSQGSVIYPAHTQSIKEVIDQGCWSRKIVLNDNGGKDDLANESADVYAKLINQDGSAFAVYQNMDGKSELLGEVHWSLLGQHNVQNGLSALVAARQTELSWQQVIDALSQFSGVKRRLEKIGDVDGISVYDDFAHHPTAIQTTLAGIKANANQARVFAVIEPRSNTMRLGTHNEQLIDSVALADAVLWYQPKDMNWQIEKITEAHAASHVFDSIDGIIDQVCQQAQSGDQVVIMSNGGFAGIHQRLVDALAAR